MSGITNTGQQLYGLDDIPYGFNPSLDMAILTFPASAASSGYSSSNDLYDFFWIVPYTFLVPLHHFGRLLRDEKALQSFYKIKIPKNLNGDG